MMALCCDRCLKIAIVHDVAEGVQRRLVHTIQNQDCFMRALLVVISVLVLLRVTVFGMDAAIVGDITPVDGVSDEDKHRMEAAAMARIRDMLGSDTAAGQQTMHGEHLHRRRRAYQHVGCCAHSAPGGCAPSGQEVEELWQEYEAASSPEAMLVKDFDKVRVSYCADGDQTRGRPHDR